MRLKSSKEGDAMLYREFCLKDYFPKLPEREKKATLTVYMRERVYGTTMEKKRPCVLICPGGAYSYHCEREAEPVALRLIGAGINAAVCRYGTSEAGAEWPDQLAEVSAALTFLRRHAEEWGCDSQKIVVLGFSAGGHVAASLGVYWNDPQIEQLLGIEHGENRPNAMALSYAVISGGEYTHEDSMHNLLGSKYSPEMLDKVSLASHVSAETPRAFIWHTKADAVVPYQNSELMAAALRENGIPCELLLFEKGVHGLGLADETTAARDEHIEPEATVWFTRFLKWVNEL